MLRNLVLSSLALLAVDGVTTVLAPVTGVSLTSDADAGIIIRRGKIKARSFRYSMVVKTDDEGDASTADVASLELTVCEGDVCSDPVDLDTNGYEGDFASSRFAYDGAEVPAGEFKLTTALVNSDGKDLGATQSWVALAEDGEFTLTPSGEVDGKPYISELSLSTDECGNGKAEATIEGDDADTVASFEVVDVGGTLFSKEDVGSCDDGACVTGELAQGKANFTESKADLGKLGESLSASEESKVTVSFTAYNSDGKELGSVTTEAVAKYGDILIDGVPLEFD